MNNKSESVCLKLTGGGDATPRLIIAHEEFQVDFQCTFR
jgi:hypothetical protein